MLSNANTFFQTNSLTHILPWREGARETEFRSSLKLSIDELHVLGAPPMQKTHLLGSLSLCSSNLCPCGVFWPSLVNPLRVELYWGAHNENKQKWYSDLPGDTKYILALTGQWTKKQKHWQTYSCHSKGKDCISSDFRDLPHSWKVERGACQVMNWQYFSAVAGEFQPLCLTTFLIDPALRYFPHHHHPPFSLVS